MKSWRKKGEEGLPGMAEGRGNERKGYDGGKGVKYSRAKIEYRGQGSLLTGKGMEGNHKGWMQESLKNEKKARGKGK